MSAERVAICPGSFDPITLGHDDIIRRSFRMADRVIVAVAYSATQVKSGMFTVEERVEMIRDTFADEPRVQPMSFQGLLVDFARAQGASLIVRGLRAVSDFEYEFQMALMNRRLWDGMETVFLAPDLEHSYLSSSLVRQIAQLGGDVSPFVPANVLARLRHRFPPAAEAGQSTSTAPQAAGMIKDSILRAYEDRWVGVLLQANARLREHPGVVDAVLSFREDAGGLRPLFLVHARERGPASDADLRDYAGRDLPSEVPPPEIHFVDHLPALHAA
ncbi:MAG TPA: pantetheine-phosphate adenylyltransferase [Longimicrobium sp.]|jgi:pantetheine-phosphate adenylyltransferase|uniref:pantetheine-phosphate adenylyltransferase n=1 Tax=Longimicrobium sp. TaxID=2029185 RepID=UPI002ED937D2